MRQHGVRYMGGFVSLFLDWINSPAVLMGTAGALVRFVSCLSTTKVYYIFVMWQCPLPSEDGSARFIYIFKVYWCFWCSGVCVSYEGSNCLSVCLPFFFRRSALYPKFEFSAVGPWLVVSSLLLFLFLPPPSPLLFSLWFLRMFHLTLISEFICLCLLALCFVMYVLTLNRAEQNRTEQGPSQNRGLT